MFAKGDGRTFSLPEAYSPERDEDWHQEYLANHLELLPLEDLEGIKSETRIIARECIENIDLLLLDDKGLLAIVEVKLAKNPESGREVLSQVLHYEAKLKDKTLKEICREIARTGEKTHLKIDKLKRFSLDLRKAFDDKKNAEEAWKRVLANYVLSDDLNSQHIPKEKVKQFIERAEDLLRAESFRMVVVTDNANREFLQVLNHLGSIVERGHQLVGVELSPTRTDGTYYFVPHLVGTATRLDIEYYRKEEVERYYKKRTVEQTISDLPHEYQKDVTKIVSELKENSDFDIRPGTGKGGNLILGLNRAGKWVSLIQILKNGSIKFVSFQLDSVAKRERYAKEIEKMPFLKQAAEKIREWLRNPSPGKAGPEPSVPFKDFGQEGIRSDKLLQLFYDLSKIET
ncbi:MAG: hypothetical protein ACRECH_14490 [Nitrososphaerales archaeon]